MRKLFRTISLISLALLMALGLSLAITRVVLALAIGITSGTVADDNSYIDVVFSEGVYGGLLGDGALETSDLSLTFTQGGGTATNVTIASLKTAGGGALAGGESTIRVMLTVTGTPDGQETIEVKPANADSIYNEEGLAATVLITTHPQNLKDQAVPTVSAIGVNDESLIEDDAGIDKFVVTIDFSEAMGATAPTIAFSPALATTLTNCDGTWTDNTYTYTCDVEDVDVTEAAVDIQVSGAKDEAGNTMDADTTTGADKFDVDTVKPTVTTITPTSLADANVGSVSVTITFSEAMDTGTNPTVTVEDLHSSSYATSNLSWPDTTHFTCQFTLIDDNEEATGHYYISGAKDAAGNTMTADNTNEVSVDTLNPTATSAIASDKTYGKEGDVIKITATFSEEVKDDPVPKIALSNAVTVDATEMSKTSSTVYYYDYTLPSGHDGNVHVTVSQATDLADNVMDPATKNGLFLIDNTNPTVSITDPSESKTVSSASYTIKGTANDPGSSGLAKVEVSIDNGSSWNDATGTSSWTYNATLASGANVIKARSIDNAGNVSDVTAGVTLTMAGSPSTIELGASKLNIPANGSSTSTITATVKDNQGNPVADGTEVSFTTTLGAITTTSGTIITFSTTIDGVAKVTLTSGTTSGTAAVKATVNGVSSTIYITFTSGAPPVITIGLTADPKSIVANGSSTSTITAVVSDEDGNPVADTEVSFTTTLGTITTSSTTTNGVAKATLTSGASSGTATISASSKGVSSTTQVDITADVVEEEVTETIPEGKTDYSVEGPAESDTTVKVTTTAEVTVTITNYTGNPHPEATSPMDSLDKHCDVSVSNPDAISWPIRVEVSYTEDEIAVKGFIEESLKLYYFKDGAWHRCSSTGVDTANNIVWAEMTEEEASGSPVDAKGTANFMTKAKLDITKVANYVSGSNPPVVGATTTYDLVIGVKNVGDNAAKNVVVKDALPSGVTYKSSSVSQGSLTLTGGSSITWSVGRLTGEADATATVTVTVKPTAADAGNCITLNNGATATGTDEPSGTSVSDGPTSPTVTLPVVQVILTIVKDGPAVADAGSTITYTITYGNISTGDATNVVISDVVPEDTTFVSATDGGTYDSATNIVTWHIELISAGTTGLAVNFDVKIDTDLPPGTTVITNQTSIASYYGTELTDEALSNEVNTTIVVPFLEIDKSVNIPTAVTGDIITYTVKLTNISTHDEALDIEIRDKLPFGIVYISNSTSINGVLASDPSGSNPFSWPIDVIGSESTATITYKCAIGLNTVAGFHDNEATIKSYSVDGITLALDSPRAMARVKVVVFETKGIIIGKVFEDLNEDSWQDKGEPGIPGIDIVMEDGTTVTTDIDGKYSIPGVEPGYHVLTIDEASLPEGYEILGEVSKFVEVPEAGMAKLNFMIVKQKKPSAQ